MRNRKRLAESPERILAFIPLNERILTVRGQKVILDADLAEVYGVTTKALNQAIKRNAGRFPVDFTFLLSGAEKAEVVTICDHLRRLKFSPVLPRAFTEHGATMAANVLNSPRAAHMSVFVVRAFVKLCPYFQKVGVAPLDGVCSTDILVVRPKEPKWFGFVLGHVSSVQLVNHTDAASTGTKTPRTIWIDISRFKIALPSKELAAKFTDKIRPIIERMFSNIHESRTLAALRDALLPKPLSGELRVPAAAKLVEAKA